MNRLRAAPTWWPSDTTIATTAYDGTGGLHQSRALARRLRAGRKASTDITYWPLAIRAGVELRTAAAGYARSHRRARHGGRAIYYDAEGREHSQPPRSVIVACNGVGTPRLLLNSAFARFPTGLANSSGLVGRNRMLHPWPMISGYVEDTLDGGAAPITIDVEQAVYETRPRRGFRARLHAAVQPRHGPGRPASPAPGRPAAVGAHHHRVFREMYEHAWGSASPARISPRTQPVTLDPC